MHEVSLIENVIALAEEARLEQPFRRIRTVRLQVGALGHADPDALRFCFDAVAAGTIAQGAGLVIDMVGGEGWCADCRRAVPMSERFDPCPICDGAQVRITAGDTLRLAELEVD